MDGRGHFPPFFHVQLAVDLWRQCPRRGGLNWLAPFFSDQGSVIPQRNLFFTGSIAPAAGRGYFLSNAGLK
jgi:hypothetical protein